MQKRDLSTFPKRVEMRFDEPLDVDEFPEFHAARLLILMFVFTQHTKKDISGRITIAKLDFFVRYPYFLEVAVKKLKEQGEDVPDFFAGEEGVESSMVRYRFGPWDHRYYNVIALIEARQLIKVIPQVRTEKYQVTIEGKELAEGLLKSPSFASLKLRCEVVAQVFGKFSGNQLKEFVYDTFQEEVTSLSSNKTIKAKRGE